MRKGYDRWNSTAMVAPATQLFWYVPIDTSVDPYLLAIVDEKWYVIDETGTHDLLGSHAATARRPIFQFGNRLIYATDAGFRWTDTSMIATVSPSQRFGILPPEEPPQLENSEAEGHVHAGNIGYVFDATITRKLAMPFIAINTVVLSRIYVLMNRGGLSTTAEGTLRASIFTNDGGSPSSNYSDGLTSDYTSAIADWLDVRTLDFGPAKSYMAFELRGNLTLLAGVTYWFVCEADSSYYDAQGPIQFWAAVQCETAPGAYKYGKIQAYDIGTDSWSEINAEGIFYAGGMEGADPDTIYDYVGTFMRSQNVIESRKSHYKRITVILGDYNGVLITAPDAPSDGQVDTWRVYRRELAAGQNLDVNPASVIDTYKFLAEMNPAAVILDTVDTDDLGAELQTDDHYAIDETDFGDNRIRLSALIPNVAVVWRDRIWFAESNSNVLHFSKILEQDGATGLTNDPIPDYFPLENKLEMRQPSGIIGLSVLATDELVVYFADESVWTIRGALQSLNPPPDINMREALSESGLIAPATIDKLGSNQYYLSRNGLFAFTGTTLNPRDMVSEDNQSILDAISTANLDDSVLITFGQQLWLLIDADDDGDLETILILDLQRDIPSRQLFVRPWRMYEYDVVFNDIIVRRTGATTISILAADAGSNYILELEIGTTDNGKAIVGEVETHDLPVDGQIHIDEVKIDANFANNVSPFAIKIIDHAGTEHDFSISPSSVYSPRGYRTGCRVTSLNRIRMKIQHRAVAADELVALSVDYS